MEGTDLGITRRTPSGLILSVFGDTFAGPGVGRPAAQPHPEGPRRGILGMLAGKPKDADWRSPVALLSQTCDLDAGVEWCCAVGPGSPEYAGVLVEKPSGASTVLPSDVVTIGDSMYLHVMMNRGLGNVLYTEFLRSDDDGRTWSLTGARIPASDDAGRRQLWTLDRGPDGYVYVLSTGFQRDKGAIASRIPESRFVDLLSSPTTAQGFAHDPAWERLGRDGGRWQWGTVASDVVGGRVGELYLRRCEDFWTLSYFNAGEYRIDVLTFTDLESLALAEAPSTASGPGRCTRTTVLPGSAWGDESDGSDGRARVAQLYCGCPLPGSTPASWHLVVSQWNTADSPAGPAGWPYRSMQFATSIPRP